MSISAHFKSNLSKAAEEITRKKEFRSQNASNSEQMSIKLLLHYCVSKLSSVDIFTTEGGIVEDLDNLQSPAVTSNLKILSGVTVGGK